MINGVYQNAASINALQTWNDVIAQNIAASPRAGYKGKSVSFEAALPRASAPDGSVARMPKMITTTNFDQGEVRTTGLDTDFAIKGPGFFPICPTPTARWSIPGMVVSSSLEREPSSTDRVSRSWVSTVRFNCYPKMAIWWRNPMVPCDRVTRKLGDLALVQFPRPDHLIDSSGGFMIDLDRPQFASPVIHPLVNQGAIESSNVSSIREMVDMISVNNAFQANQRVISSIDRAMERAIEVLGNT